MKKRITELEKKIKNRAIMAYCLIAAVCLGMLLYVYTLRGSIYSQKQNVESYYDVLSLTNEVLFSVNEAQSYANLYISSKNPVHFHNFRNSVDEVEILIDSLSGLTSDTLRSGILHQISGLLEQKGKIIYRLDTEFGNYSPVDLIGQRLRPYETVVLTDSVFISSVVSDTVVRVTNPKGFWQRITDVFVPENSIDTMVSITTVQTDTLRRSLSDTVRLASAFRDIQEEARASYNRKLSQIEREFGNLLATDQEITQQITGLVHRLHRQAIRSTLKAIERSESQIKRNYTFSLIGGLAALGLILVMIILIINDVNKGHAARKALEEANGRIRQVMESRHKLLLSVSHDIKTPLNSIMGYLELWDRENGLTGEQVSRMLYSGKHIRTLLDNLLGFSALEKGMLTLEGKPFAVNDVIAETLQIMEPLAARKKLTLHRDIDIPEGFIHNGDALRLKQVLLNVVSNAVKYTREGEIVFRAFRDGERLVFKVSDTGVGITADKLGSVFEPFSRVADNNSLAEGSGFGMYVVKGYVELMGGDINIDSTVGQGTTVTVNIPYVPAPNNSQRVLKTGTDTPGLPPGKKVLVVDDDRTLLEVLEHMFRRSGQEAVFLNHPERVGPHIENEPGTFGMVITDMEMGTLSGTDVLGAVRSRLPGLPVLVMTGREDIDTTRASELGFDGLLRKPVNINDLREAIGIPVEKAAPSYNYSSLADMLGGDQQAINEIMFTFVEVTRSNVKSLREHLWKGDFKSIQRVCHTMYPMFMQVGADDCASILRKIDSARDPATARYRGWKDDVRSLIGKAEELVNNIGREIRSE